MMKTMNKTITAEITLYALSENYEQIVLDYIQQLKAQAGIRIRVTGMSTYIHGVREDVFDAIKASTRLLMEGEITVSFVVKYLNTDAFDNPEID